MAVLRTEIPVGYKTTIVRTLIQGLRAAFSSAYPEADFASLNIVNEFPLTEIEYPAIVIKYQERTIPNAGVGHVEYFNDPDGNLRKWYHRRFEGGLEFTICALSPLDRDVLSNALVEVVAFGQLDALLNQFFTRVYGEIGVNPGILGLLHQISLNTDIITATGESQNIAPWEPEDALVYQNGYMIDCHGGFYNSPRSTSPLLPIQVVKSYPYIDTNITVDLNPETQWSFVFDYDDADAVIGQAVISTREDTYDAATVISTGVISAVEDFVPNTFVRQYITRADNGVTANQSAITWNQATLAGNHLFMVIGVRGNLNIFGGISINVPAGWTLLSGTPPHGVENTTGAGIFILYKLASASRSGVETVTFNDQPTVGELPIRWTAHLFEIGKQIVTNLTPSQQSSATYITPFNSGYNPGNLSGSGMVFTGSGAALPSGFSIAAVCTPDGALSDPKHLDANNGTLSPDQEWDIIGTTSSVSPDTNSPSVTVVLRKNTAASATALRMYWGDNTFLGVNDLFPAGGWLAFA